MPSAALRPCSPTCSNKVARGRCPLHAPRERDRANVDVRRLYRTARWKAIRAQKFAEDPACIDCAAEGRLTPWTDLDHRIPHRGDPVLFWDVDNLEGRCKSCHSRKTARGE